MLDLGRAAAISFGIARRSGRSTRNA